MKVERQAGRLVATDGFTSGGSAAAAPRNSGTPLDRDRGREGGVLESHGTGREQEEQSEEDFFFFFFFFLFFFVCSQCSSADRREDASGSCPAERSNSFIEEMTVI